MAPHGVYLCSGEDEWVAIAVGSDQEWQNLCEVLKMPELAHNPRFEDASSRWKNQDELDLILNEWTKDKSSYDVMQSLQGVGIAATPVESSEMIFDDPHYQARELVEFVDQPSTGPQFLPGVSWKMSKTPGEVRWPAPQLGEHNEVIYSNLLGMTDAELAQLEAEDIIGKVPKGIS